MASDATGAPAFLEVVERLARKTLDKAESSGAQKRIVIAISGVPGSGKEYSSTVALRTHHANRHDPGKTTLAAAVSARINELYAVSHAGEAPIAVDLPMDGFHLTRAQLRAMPNPDEAAHRRGAAFTFDGEGILTLARSLTALPRQTVRAPAFDHATKDPVADAIEVNAAARIVLIEGNYCALNREPWKTAAGLMDELWYVDVSSKVAHARLAKRHLASGIVADEQEAWERASGTDELNAVDIRENRLPCSEVITMG